MIIRATEREDFRRVNENDLDIDDRERIEFIAPENPRFIQVTRDTFGRSKNWDLRYTKESPPYFVEHCIPRLLDREVLFDLPRRISFCEISFREFT